MNHVWNLVKKELRELITPSSMASVIVMMVVFISLGSLMSGEISSQMETQPIGYADMTVEDDSYSENSIAILKSYYADTYKVDPEKYVLMLDITESSSENDILKAMQDKNVTSAIVFQKDFNSNINAGISSKVSVYWNQTSTSVFSSLSTVAAVTAVSIVNSSVSTTLIHDIDPTADSSFVINPVSYNGSTYFNGTLHSGVSPDQIYSALSTQSMFVPIIIMLVIIMIGSILISSMGNEKENKTLETLLTLPVNRTTIVTGKLIGSAIAGLIMGALYMVGMYFYISGVTKSATGGSVSIESLGLSLSITDWLIVAAFMFLAILCALGLCMILGAFAKNYKAAQMYIMPISVLAMIPMFVTMFSNVSDLPTILQAVIYAIPFTHPMTVMQNLMFNNTSMIIVGFVYLVIFALVTIFITVRLYKSDILLTGLIKKNKKASLFAKKENTQ